MRSNWIFFFLLVARAKGHWWVSCVEFSINDRVSYSKKKKEKTTQPSLLTSSFFFLGEPPRMRTIKIPARFNISDLMFACEKQNVYETKTNRIKLNNKRFHSRQRTEWHPKTWHKDIWLKIFRICISYTIWARDSRTPKKKNSNQPAHTDHIGIWTSFIGFVLQMAGTIFVGCNSFLLRFFFFIAVDCLFSLHQITLCWFGIQCMPLTVLHRLNENNFKRN